MRGSKPILLVEDDSIDVLTVKRSLSDLKVTNKLIHKPNGEEALKYLTDHNNPKPCIILLDLNMPKMNGIELLRHVKASDSLKKIPIVVLTTSQDEQDIVESFQLNVAGYMVKAVDYKKFVETIRAIDLYWTLNEMPPNTNDDQMVENDVVRTGAVN